MRRPASLVILVLAMSGCGGLTPNSSAAPPAYGHNSLSKEAQVRRLFVTDPGASEVYVYYVPLLKLATILQAFKSPQGACADNKGDVWITDDDPDEVFEVTYIGKTIGHVAGVTGFRPQSCAWDPKTGNLAVTNNSGGTKSGEILIYADGKGSPTAYKGQFFFYSYAGYDDSGNLFFDGGSRFRLYELPYGQKTPEKILLSGAKIYKAGTVQWDETAGLLDVGDQNCHKAATSCIYQFAVSGNTATETNEIDLKTSSGTKVCDVAEAAVSNGEIYGSDYDSCGYAKSATYGWPYPAGGSPEHQQHRIVSKPIGAAMATT